MTRLTHIQARFVEFIPDRLEPGILYISRKYATASHLCCCGCGLEVVTPLNPAKWHLSETDDTVSLAPSIGNWSFPCQSHYWISRGQVDWASAMSPERIEVVRQIDIYTAETYAEMSNNTQTIGQRIIKVLIKVIQQVRQLVGW